jgi:ATP-dependent Clp protease ATP-binding subunit ClpX
VSQRISNTRSTDLSALDLYLSSERVIGQEKARRQLAVMLQRQREVATGKWDHSRPAIIGGFTGTGKSMLARIMCEACGLPFADVNATQYTETGYAGDDLSQMFLPLIESAAEFRDKRLRMEAPNVSSVLKRADIDYVAETASTGVILMDEFDKWMQRINHHTGRLDTAIQAELLKMIEGSTVYVSDNEDEAGIPFDTSKVLILCAGAFVGLAEQVRRRLERSKEAVIDEAFWLQIEQSDFIRFGVIPELAGRLSRMIFLRPLLKDHLAVIISQPKGPIDELKKQFSDLNCEWQVPPETVGSLADMALRREVGARGIDSVLWAAFSDALFQASVAEYPTVVRLAVNQVRAEVVAG